MGEKDLGACELSPPSTTRWQRTEIVRDKVLTSSLSFPPCTLLCNLPDWLTEWIRVLGLVARARFVFVHPVRLYHYHFFLVRLAGGERWMPHGVLRKDVQLFALKVLKHDETSSMGKFSEGPGLIKLANANASQKGCWILAKSLFGRIMSGLISNE